MKKERNSFLFIPLYFSSKTSFSANLNKNRQILLNTLQNCNLSISKFMLKWYELYANNDAKVIMYMKKIFSILLVFLLSISSLGVTTSHAEEKYTLRQLLHFYLMQIQEKYCMNKIQMNY